MILPALLGAASALPAGVGLAVHLRGRRAPSQPPSPLTAVVLGARVYADGTPSPALVDRVKVGVALLHAGQATRLLLSGGTPDGRPTEAAVMATLARAAGAPASALLQESQSRSTFENAARCAELLSAQGAGEVLLVTCDFHLARAAAQFRAHGLTVWPWPSRRTLGAADRLMVTGREVVGLLRRPRLLFYL